ncbi:MAG: acetate/propionate family kinase [Coxiellaceae bacterium]|nr:MAG: acetate/propionate family kinase [Coxiellaceae bacterium]
MMRDSLFILNAGSSSIKFALFAINHRMTLEIVVRGQISSLDEKPHFLVRNQRNDSIHQEIYANQSKRLTMAHKQALEKIVYWLELNYSQYKIFAAGHRIVHGGHLYTQPVLIDDAIVNQLERFNGLAPLHQPYTIFPIKFLSKRYPQLCQVACFDTAFHQTQLPLARLFALPDDIAAVPIRRYGFHGLSYEYIAQVLPNYLGKHVANSRIIIAHLGYGASLCAIRERKSVATTMGFSVLEGLPMGTRCGTIDPGVLLYLLTNENMSVKQLSELLYEHSGLLGLSSISGDIQVLLENKDRKAKLAIDYFVYHINREIGALTATLNGLDGLIFTAGIGENSPDIRAKICDLASWLGIRLNPVANNKNESCISSSESAIPVWVIPTNEESIIAQHTFNIMKTRQ